jgi:hypothetical protein
MFSRSTAPAACVSGNDSIGRHTRCCSMRDSAWAGVSSDILLEVSRRARASRSGGFFSVPFLAFHARSCSLKRSVTSITSFTAALCISSCLRCISAFWSAGHWRFGEARVELGLDAAEVAVHVRVVLHHLDLAASISSLTPACRRELSGRNRDTAGGIGLSGGEPPVRTSAAKSAS